MARTALALSTLLLAGACGSPAVTTAAPAAPLPVEPGQPFVLKPGQVATVVADGLRIGFEGVGDDSRCPKGVQCVWAGDATVRVWMQERGGPRAHGELHTAPARSRAFTAGGRTLQLSALDPWPVSGRPIEAAAYAARLVLEGAGAGDSR